MINLRAGDPASPEGRALLGQSHALMNALYPAEDNHYLSIDALCASHIRFFIAEQDGAAQGCIALARNDGYGEIKSLYVTSQARGAGVGMALMQAVENCARDNALTCLKLETGDTLAAAHRLYARAGFTICPPFGDYEKGPHSVFMEKYLPAPEGRS